MTQFVGRNWTAARHVPCASAAGVFAGRCGFGRRAVHLSAAAELLSKRHGNGHRDRRRVRRDHRCDSRRPQPPRRRALIGAGVGALTGNVLGRAQDQADERRAATGAAVVAGMNQQAAAAAVTNLDLINMARAGVGDDLIISTIQSRGAARFEPAGVDRAEAKRRERSRADRSAKHGGRPRLRCGPAAGRDRDSGAAAVLVWSAAVLSFARVLPDAVTLRGRGRTCPAEEF